MSFFVFFLFRTTWQTYWLWRDMWLCMLYNHNIPPYVLAPTGHCCCVAVKYRGWAPLNSEVHTVPASFKLLSGTDAKVGRSVYADQNIRVLLAWVPFYMVFLNHIMPLCYFSAFPFCTFSFCSREGDTGEGQKAGPRAPHAPPVVKQTRRKQFLTGCSLPPI